MVHIKRIKYLADDLAQQLELPILGGDSKIDEGKLELLIETFVTLTTTENYKKRQDCMKELEKTLTVLPRVRIDINPVEIENHVEYMADIIISMPQYTNYMTYVASIPYQFLSPYALSFVNNGSEKVN